MATLDSPARSAGVALEGVSKIYPMGELEVRALDAVDLEVPSGGFVVVLGPSGSGKTTLLNLVGGLDVPTEGRVVVDGTDITNYSLAELTAFRRQHVGFVFQFFNLIPTLTALENVQVAAELTGRADRASEVLALVGLAERQNHFPAQLSGGEQQRVAIARALSKAPGLLLCDEPTGELDYQTGKRIMGLLRELNRTEGTTVLVVTHNTAIAAVADIAVRLRDGRVDRVTHNPTPMPADELRW